MNNLLELIVLALGAVMRLRADGLLWLTGDVIEGLAVLRSAMPNSDGQYVPFGRAEEALAWLRQAGQWDLAAVVHECALGKSVMVPDENGEPESTGGPVFLGMFIESVKELDPQVAGEPPDARKVAQMMIEIGQSKSAFQILRAAAFEDLVVETLEGFAQKRSG